MPSPRPSNFSDIPPGSRWRHFKGRDYVVVCLSILEETGEAAVTYKDPVDGGNWTRTFRKFAGMVDHPGGQFPRFTRLPDCRQLPGEEPRPDRA